MKHTSLLLSFLFIFSFGYSQTFQVGNKVEAYNSGGWYKATITQVGADNYTGYYYVKYDEYSSSQWIKSTNLRLLKSTAAIASMSPRNGTYIILSYGNPTNPLRIGYFDLNAGTYKYYNLAKKLIGQGSYSFDAANKRVSWNSGPFKTAGFGGTFEIDREGKTHKIRLNGATIGSNSTDSQ